ncbi:MAG: hypothetical protein AAGF23_16030 [Acidobacteriota bacterium]
MSVPTNGRLGQILRAIRHAYLNRQRAKDLVARLRPQMSTQKGPDRRGPSRSLSLSAYLRRETGEVDLELSTFLMVLSEAGIKVQLVDDDGRLLPPQFQLSTLPAREPTGVDYLAMAADLQRQVDRLVNMASPMIVQVASSPDDTREPSK